ncbi:DUF4435 domain-containing protein [Moritella viscosa]|uniref:DUF4435 domain-containing protein n=1 Tax=Moritella viscosa TaxID=80854 RepID=UPI000916F94E|nr:DUF4435 domain-containing protein [Moritella viscosa]SHN99499.1 Putative uncharacterized protein [Moritella viscosa]SHN99502.1 Putative uncharacterized protein [Moritella viscosa]SHO00776.1 Putative uncharacterized protein [Moritella viscosa]SHO02006.1 Putative uncharacterized protein [Moritella viscosa]
MASIPKYTAEENLFRVLMDKNSKYLVVEGPFDMPIYEELLELLCARHVIVDKPITVFGGGKRKITTWAEKNTLSNTSIIFDMDFESTLENSALITYLKRYSIENYFFDVEVISPLIAQLLTTSSRDVMGVLSLSDLISHWEAELKSLLPVLYYYQEIYSGDKEKWNNVFINQSGGDWQLCTNKVSQFTDSLLADMNVDYITCQHAFNENFPAEWCPKINFPGKIILESFHRYLKFFCNSEKSGSYGCISSPKALTTQLASRLINNPELEGILLESVG